MEYIQTIHAANDDTGMVRKEQRGKGSVKRHFPLKYDLRDGPDCNKFGPFSFQTGCFRFGANGFHPTSGKAFV